MQTVNMATPQYYPYAAGGQMAPQGILGSVLGFAAPAIGGLIGDAFGNKKLGQQIGGVAGTFAHLIPLQAGPGEPVQYVQMAPQGIFGDIAGALGAPVGGLIGGWLGNQQAGQQIGGTLGGLAQQFSPFSAVPVAYGQMAPQGIFGDIAGALGGPVGGAIGGLFGNRQLGQQIGGTVGGLAQQFSPFSAVPAGYGQMAPMMFRADQFMDLVNRGLITLPNLPQTVQLPPNGQMAPQGIFGDIAGALGGPVGGAIGGLFGNRQLGQRIGGTVGGLAQQFSPFSAVPAGYGQMAPQGIFGDIAGALGAPVGGLIGGWLGNQQAGQQIGGTLGGLAQQFSPFSAVPVGYGQMAPQGIFGDIAGALGGPVGGAIGGLFGNRQLGQQIGGTVGGLAQQFSPFSAVPSGYGQMAPQGIFGDIAGALGGPVGGAIGGLFGNRQLGQRIGGTVGGLAQQFSPFAAVPSGYGQMAPQGIFGDIAGALGAPVGGLIGGWLGNQQAGQQIGGTLGGLAQQFSPFSVLPAQQVYGYPTVH
jgi:phage shock protein PspC (stress-responsive transcriptional regulator)